MLLCDCRRRRSPSRCSVQSLRRRARPEVGASACRPTAKPARYERRLTVSGARIAQMRCPPLKPATSASRQVDGIVPRAISAYRHAESVAASRSSRGETRRAEPAGSLRDECRAARQLGWPSASPASGSGAVAGSGACWHAAAASVAVIAAGQHLVDRLALAGAVAPGQRSRSRARAPAAAAASVRRRSAAAVSGLPLDVLGQLQQPPICRPRFLGGVGIWQAFDDVRHRSPIAARTRERSRAPPAVAVRSTAAPADNRRWRR